MSVVKKLLIAGVVAAGVAVGVKYLLDRLFVIEITMDDDETEDDDI